MRLQCRGENYFDLLPEWDKFNWSFETIEIGLYLCCRLRDNCYLIFVFHLKIQGQHAFNSFLNRSILEQRWLNIETDSFQLRKGSATVTPRWMADILQRLFEYSLFIFGNLHHWINYWRPFRCQFWERTSIMIKLGQFIRNAEILNFICSILFPMKIATGKLNQILERFTLFSNLRSFWHVRQMLHSRLIEMRNDSTCESS